jgi:hypothetical protein
MDQGCRNLTLDELMQDGVTRAVMRADGVDPEALDSMLRGVAARIAGMPVREPGRQSSSRRRECLPAKIDNKSEVRSGCLASLRSRLQFHETP